ncbi:MAG: NYN domain-containing protein [bacterium]|jgi:uncharacterized LabA/DUF88 family protein
MRVIAYIDGFNLYYGCLKDSPFRWLDLVALTRKLAPGQDIQRVKYFTALVKDRGGSSGKRFRQQVYLRALRCNPLVEIHLGRFLTNVVALPLAGSAPNAPKLVKVLKTQEKGSDVNLATHLVADALLDRFDSALVVTNDSDLLEAIRTARNLAGKRVGIVNPQKRASAALQNACDFYRPIRANALAACQLPDRLTDGTGSIHKPAGW